MIIFQHDAERAFSLLIEHGEKFTRIIRHDRASDREFDIIVSDGHPVVIDVVDGVLTIRRGGWVKAA